MIPHRAPLVPPLVWLLVWLLVLPLALAVGACGGDPADAAIARAATVAPPSAAARETLVEAVVVNLPLALPAQLYVEHDAVIAARAAGEVDSLHVDLGSVVHAGALLATVESADQRLAVERSEAEYEAALRLVERARSLSRVGGVTGAESEQTELAARQAALALAQARRQLALTRVTAPFAGVVSARYARPHRLVAVGDTLFRVTEHAPLLARVHVPEALAGALRVGGEARVVGVHDAHATATVWRIAPVVDAASGTREVVLRVPSTGGLLAGSGVTVRLAAERRRAVVVSRHLVDPDGYVLVLEGARPTLRAVTLGAEVDGGRVEVLSGLSWGDRIVRPGG